MSSPDEIYTEFLKFCPPVPSDILKLLRSWGIDAATAEQFSLRFSFRGYRTAVTKLGKRFGREALLTTGLVRETRVPRDQVGPGETQSPQTMIFGTFEAYRHAQVPYLVIPYFQGGKITFLKARALLDSSDLKSRKLPESITTADRPPSFYNVDAVSGVERVIIVKRELDAIAATRNSMTAVSCSKLSDIRAEWARALADKHVILVLDNRWKSDPNLGQAKRMLEDAGVKSLRGIPVPATARGLKLVKLLSSELDRKESSSHGSGIRIGSGQFEVGEDSVPALADDEIDMSDSGRAKALAPSDSGLLTAELEGGGSDARHRQFVATIPLELDRTLVIHVVEREGSEFLLCQYYQPLGGEWQATEEMFTVPMKKAQHLLAAITAATQGRTLTEKPPWLD